MTETSPWRAGAPARRTRNRLTGVVGVVAASALALTGCTASANSNTNTAAPIKGTTLTIAEQQAPTSLNPGFVKSDYTDFTQLAYDPLLYVAPTGKITGRLASSYAYVGSDNTELQLTIRSGVKFSDGEPLTAEAVANSLDYSRDAKGPEAYLLAGMTFSGSGNTVRIKAKSPNPDIPRLLTQTYNLGQVISPAALKSPTSLLTLQKTSSGAGAYVYQPGQSVNGDHYTYTANPTYYDKSQQHFKKVVLKIVGDEQAALNATKTGQIDVFKGDQSVASQAKTAGLNVVASPAILTGLFITDRQGATLKALGNVKVRQAINYALDRASMTTALMGEYGTSTFQTLPKGVSGYSTADANLYSYDVAKAKSLLAEAGYPNGFTLPVVTGTFAGFNVMADAYKGQLAKVGINMQVKVESSLVNYSTDILGKKFPAFMGGATEPDMYSQGIDFWMSGPTFYNPFGYTDPTLAALWTKAASAPAAQRAALDEQMQHYVLTNAWLAPVAFAPVVYFTSKKVGGVSTGPGRAFASPIDIYATK